MNLNLEKYKNAINLDLEKLVVVFKKNKYSVTELSLAQALGMHVIGDSIVVARIKSTSKRSMFVFQKNCFREFTELDSYQQHRTQYYNSLSSVYKTLYSKFFEIAAKRWSNFDKEHDFQKECSYYGVFRKINLHALEQGLGKSLVAISVSEILNIQVTLILAPAACKWNWMDELTFWGVSPYDITVLDSKHTHRSPTERYIILNYAMLKKYSEYIKSKSVGHIIVDECHKIKNTDSNRSRAFRDLYEEIDCRLSLLSGTPTPNKIDDLFVYLNLSGHPDGLDKAKFIREYTETVKTKYGSTVLRAKNIDKLSDRCSNLIIRRTKEQFKDKLNLPEKIYHKLEFEFEDFKEEYDEAYSTLVAELKKKKNRSSIELVLNRLSIIASKAKIKYIIKLAEGIVGERHSVRVDRRVVDTAGVSIIRKVDEKVFGKVVIFSVFSEPIAILERHFGDRCVKIDGSTPPKKRMELVREFRRNNKKNFFLANLTAGGIGFNLVNREEEKDRPPICNTIHVNFPFTNAELEQGNDRTYRIGQYVDCNYYYTVLKGSVDEKIYKLVENKYGDISHFLDGQRKEFDFNNISTEIIEEFADELLAYEDSKKEILTQLIE